eukprot:COSAG02_NODE_2233_length_9425_cov_2.280399_3_plen_59_part_00
MCEAERTHHPTPKLEELVRSTDLQFVIHLNLNKMLCFRHIATEQADGDNLNSNSARSF